MYQRYNSRFLSTGVLSVKLGGFSLVFEGGGALFVIPAFYMLWNTNTYGVGPDGGGFASVGQDALKTGKEDEREKPMPIGRSRISSRLEKLLILTSRRSSDVMLISQRLRPGSLAWLFSFSATSHSNHLERQVMFVSLQPLQFWRDIH